MQVVKPSLPAALVLAMIIAAACSKKSSGPSAFGSMNATVDTSHFNGTNCLAQHSNGSFNPYSLSVFGGFFTGSTLSYPYINLNISNYTGVGQYLIDSVSNTASIDSGVTPVKAVRGAITILSISGNITGSFSFVTTDSTRVSGGYFSTKAP